MGYIFESEIEQIKNVVRSRTIGEGESITLRGILMSRIHPAIKAYFKAEVERNLEQERQLESRSKKFPYSIPELVSLQHQEDLLLMVHYQFNQHEFDTLLDQAVHFTFNFLCRPQFTLVEFLFENQRHMSIASIEKKLNYCADYDYYAILLKRYFADRGLTEISYEEFKSLLKKIDVEIVARHSGRELATMTRAIKGFVDAVRDGSEIQGPSKTLPINAAIVFFEDKELTEIKLRLEYERDHNKLMEIDISQLAGLIEDVRSITSDHPVGRVVAEVETAEPNAVVDRPLKVSIERGAGERTEAIKQSEVVQRDEETPAVPTPEIQVEKSLTIAPETEAVNLPKISSLLSPSEEKKILKSIFHKDKEELQATLDALDRAGSWEEASLILDDLFLARDVSPQSKVAIVLTEKTYERYGSKKDRNH
jgi:hypothetical protein